MLAEIELDQILTPTDSFIDFVVRGLTPEVILSYQADEDNQARAELLVGKLQAGTLTPGEVRELQTIRAENRLVIALKARALELLNAS
jgi:ribosomal protein S1